MSSKRCPKCGLVDFADAETCKRCGERLLTARQTAFRERLDAAPAAPGARPASTFALAVYALVGLAVAAIVILGVHSWYTRGDIPETAAPAPPPPVSEEVTRRRQFARGLQAMTVEGAILKNITVTTEDASDKTLAITADNMLEDDCSIIHGSTYMRAAELAGFELLVCRGRGGGEWKKRLIPH